MSENRDGGLAFKATLDIDDFNVSAEAMERRIRNTSTNIGYEAERMDDSILNFARNGAKYIVSYLIANGMSQLANSIVQTRGQFQQLDIAFETMLGSASKSQALMDQMIETAARTPFDLKGVAGGAKQLLAYGFAADEVNDTLIRLGNIASGLSVPLNDMVYLYGTTMTQGRLYAQDMRQFMGRGIPLAKELASMYGKTTEEINEMVSAGKVGFADVEKVITKMTNSGGQFFNLMEKQSKSLTGMISNLGDAWDMALNDLGEQNQDVFAKGIEGATYMVEHFDDILRILKSIAIGYGTYKAAIVANTLVTKGFTGVALIDNTVRQAKIALLKAEEAATGRNKDLLDKMTKAELDNIAALRTKITLEQHEQALRIVKTEALRQLLTLEQQRYLSNKNLVSGSAEYIKEAESILSVEQRMVLNRANLSSSSIAYADTIKRLGIENDNSIKGLKDEIKFGDDHIKILTDQKRLMIEKVEMGKRNLLAATESGNAKKIENAETKLSVLQTNLDNKSKELNTAITNRNTNEKRLSTLETQRGTAATAADTTSKVANTTATTVLTGATNRLKLAMQTLWATMKANPIGWIITAIGLLVSGFTLLNRKQKETEENAINIANANKKASEEFASQASKIDTLVKIMNNSNISYNERNKALNELKGIIPGYNAMLDQEGVLIHNNTLAIDEYLKALERQIKLKAMQEELEAAYRQKRLDEKAAREKIESGRQAVSYQGGSPTLGGVQYEIVNWAYTDEEAEKMMREATEKTAETIAELNEEIKNTSLLIGESEKNTRSYSKQIIETEKEIRSINKEIKDMRAGKIVNDNLATAIEERTKDLKDAEKRLSVLTGQSPTGGKGSEKMSEEIASQQIKLEQARIEIMEDGFDKRKAIIDLEHQQNLLSIKKEEDELLKLRKESGKGLTPAGSTNFQERRSLENDRYLKAQNNLFNDEIGYKKEQYQLYWRWVENMGKDVANKRFSSLIKEGESYKSYLENQLAILNAKKSDGSLTSSEGNLMFSLKSELNEISGEKSALDLFKSGLDESIRSASTLAEKIKLVADATEKLKSGQTGIVGEDNVSNAKIYVQDKQDDNERLIRERLIQDFKTFEERKSQIVTDYNLLRIQKQVQSNNELLNKINQGEAEALSSLNAEILMQSQSWKDLFTNLDTLSASQIEKLITDIKTKMQSADLKLTPADFTALMESLTKAEQKVVSLNPFRALGSSFDSYIVALKELKAAERDNLSPEMLSIKKRAVKDAAAQMAESIASITDVVGTVGDSIGSIADAFGASDTTAVDIQAITGALAGTGQAAGGVAKIMAGDLAGGIKDVVTGITSVITNMTRLGDNQREKEIQSLQKNIDKLKKSYEDLGDQIDRAYGSSKADMIKQESQYLEEYNKNIRKQIEAEEAKKKTDKKKIEEWQNVIDENEKKITENQKYRAIEAIIGTDIKNAIDQFADAYADAWSKGEKAAGKSADVVKSLIKNSIIGMLKDKLKPEVEAFMKYLAEALDGGVITAAEQNMINDWEKRLEDMADKELSGKEKWLKDDDEVEESKDPLTGAIRGMSEETGSLVAGKMNAIVINQSSMVDSLRESLMYQKEIAANTRYLESIDARLGRIESKDNSLLNNGLTN